MSFRKLKIIINKLTLEYEQMCAVHRLSEYDECRCAYTYLDRIERYLCKGGS